MKRNNLKLIKSFIKIFLSKQLKQCAFEDGSDDNKLLNLVLFTSIIFAFRKLEQKKQNRSEEILRNPKIFWKLLKPKLINSSYLTVLIYLSQYSERKQFYRSILNTFEERHILFPSVKNQYLEYEPLLPIIDEINLILAERIKDNKQEVLSLVTQVDELKSILENLFVHSTNYLVYIYFMNLFHQS
ncbi:hypothetical protein J2Z62_000618 [Mycoplasmoides fastidiosum]|uniref:Uncharacterized protein n=1 Tax=Mycoplasmoides fastidiosum TaxID=92758 RepID=A0ABU0LZQ1_9BACT|nr:hypothetical protein [Mycoplasmoides fastidiosum]MDQ0514180.1 hypothetical protein [Mycoplasmoides fastidiosum]UUD37407.1 hypothetical protein NPA10_02400 [Mycoplasmoides fastidiosum]